MLRRFSLKYVLFSLIIDVFCVMGALALAVYLRRVLPYGRVEFNPLHPDGIPPVTIYLIASLLWAVTAFTISLYDPKKSYKAVDEFQTLTLTTFFFALVLAGALYFTIRTTSRLLMIYALVGMWTLMVSWRIIARVGFRLQKRKHLGTTRVLVIGAASVGQQVADMIVHYAWTGLEFAGYLDDDLAKHGNGLKILGTLEDVRAVVMREYINDVILALPPQAYQRMNQVVSMLHTLPVNVRVIPDYFSLALYRATVEDFGGIPMINLRDPALNDYQRLVKRIFDLVFGSLFTLLALPLMGVVALAIIVDSRGPVIFRQKRVGENGQLFDMFKFRSMIAGAEEMQDQVNHTDDEGHTVHKVEDDPRVTRVGRSIRRWSLDELPQFFNVLKGDISLVGPRPELPWLVAAYEPWQHKRFAVPQGLTGWWQVNGRSNKLMHLHTDEDLYYIQNYSLWLDIYIILKTPWVVLKGKGAF